MDGLCNGSGGVGAKGLGMITPLPPKNVSPGFAFLYPKNLPIARSFQCVAGFGKGRGAVAYAVFPDFGGPGCFRGASSVDGLCVVWLSVDGFGEGFVDCVPNRLGMMIPLPPRKRSPGFASLCGSSLPIACSF